MGARFIERTDFVQCTPLFKINTYQSSNFLVYFYFIILPLIRFQLGEANFLNKKSNHKVSSFIVLFSQGIVQKVVALCYSSKSIIIINNNKGFYYLKAI